MGDNLWGTVVQAVRSYRAARKAARLPPVPPPPEFVCTKTDTHYEIAQSDGKVYRVPLDDSDLSAYW